MGYTAGQGVLIDAVDPYGPAFEATLRIPRNFVLLSINKQEIRTVDDVNRITRGLRPGQIVSLVVRGSRDGSDAPVIYNYRAR
jgi:S1-C subfamily serine protease